MIELAFLNVLIFIYLKLTMDITVHYNAFKKMGFGKFFWKETVEAPKTTWFHKYFPMFYDVWHLCTFLQVCQVCLIVSIPCHNIYCFPIFVITGSLIFNFFNDIASKIK